MEASEAEAYAELLCLKSSLSGDLKPWFFGVEALFLYQDGGVREVRCIVT